MSTTSQFRKQSDPYSLEKTSAPVKVPSPPIATKASIELAFKLINSNSLLLTTSVCNCCQ
jgi:hypothetical protein